MTSITDNINQAIGSTHYDSPCLKIKMNGCHQHRRSFDEPHKQENDDLKGTKHDQLSSASQSKIGTKDRTIGVIDNDDDDEDMYRAAVNSLGPYDVICGRGSLAFNNIGNRRFRILIGMNVNRYNDTEGRHRKGLFIGSLVGTFLNEIGARFFKLKQGELIELTERQIRQKVGHALRDVLAFQESQQQQKQQLLLQYRTESKNTRPMQSTTKSKPWIKGPTTAMSRSQAALSSIRSRMYKIRMERDAMNLQNRALQSPFASIPLVSLDSQTSTEKRLSLTHSFTDLRGFRAHGKRTKSRANSILSVENLPGMSNQHRSSDNKMRLHYEIDTNHSNHHTNDTFNHGPSDISDSLQDIDLVPIPLDGHQEDDKIFEF